MYFISKVASAESLKKVIGLVNPKDLVNEIIKRIESKGLNNKEYDFLLDVCENILKK